MKQELIEIYELISKLEIKATPNNIENLYVIFYNIKRIIDNENSNKEKPQIEKGGD